MLYICVNVCVCMYIYSIHVFIDLLIYLSVHLFTCLLIRLFIYIYVHVHIYMCTILYLCRFTHTYDTRIDCCPGTKVSTRWGSNWEQPDHSSSGEFGLPQEVELVLFQAGTHWKSTPEHQKNRVVANCNMLAWPTSYLEFTVPMCSLSLSLSLFDPPLCLSFLQSTLTDRF